MDFTLSPEIESLRVRVRAFVEEHVLPLESDPHNFSEHENIPDERLAPVREKARKAGLWAPQSPKEYGGMDLPMVAWAVMYEEAARSLFGPLAFNCMAPDDGNMNLLKKAGTPAQKEKWLKPIVEGKVRSSFAMTEPAPGGGSDPSMIKTYAEKHGEHVEDLRPQVVHHRSRRRRAFHPCGPHLRRQAQGHHHVPVPQGPARLAHRAPHRDLGAGGARRPLRAGVRRPRGARRRHPRRSRQRPEDGAGAARPGAAHPLHALARLVEALHGDRAGIRRTAARASASGSPTARACR